MCFRFLSLFRPFSPVCGNLGVVASSNVNGNNGSLATTIENRTSFTNNSHYNGTINELIVSETIPNSNGIDAEHMAVDVATSLSSLSLTRINNNNNSGIVSSVDDGAVNKENDGVQMPTVTHAATAATPAAAVTAATIQKPTAAEASAAITILNATVHTQTSPTVAKMATMHTTIAPLNGDHITNHMQTSSQFIASSNTRRDDSSPPTPSTLPITTNKPRKYIPYTSVNGQL